MQNADVSVRVKRHLNRYIVWLESGLRGLDALSGAVDDAQLEAEITAQARREAELEHLWREQRGLLREWRDGTAAEAQRAEVRALAARAQDLTEALRQRQAMAMEQVSQRIQEGGRALGVLERGRDVLEKYRPGGADISMFLDKRA